MYVYIYLYIYYGTLLHIKNEIISFTATLMGLSSVQFNSVAQSRPTL